MAACLFAKAAAIPFGATRKQGARRLCHGTTKSRSTWRSSAHRPAAAADRWLRVAGGNRARRHGGRFPRPADGRRWTRGRSESHVRRGLRPPGGTAPFRERGRDRLRVEPSSAPCTRPPTVATPVPTTWPVTSSRFLAHEPIDLIQARVRARLGVAVAPTGDVQALSTEELAAAWRDYQSLQADYDRSLPKKEKGG